VIPIHADSAGTYPVMASGGLLQDVAVERRVLGIEYEKLVLLDGDLADILRESRKHGVKTPEATVPVSAKTSGPEASRRGSSATSIDQPF